MNSRKSLTPGTLLPQSFYSRHTLQVAQELLGKIVVVSKSGITAGRIVETEAYRADDAASHCARGETPRSSIMFREAGMAYVYFIYGMYTMLNFVTEPVGSPGAVLIRAVEPVRGMDLMTQRRKRKIDLTNGPGRLCQAMGINLSDNGQSLQGPVFTVYDDGYQVAAIGTSGRIGISAAQDKLWRFYVRGNPHVSGQKNMRN